MTRRSRVGPAIAALLALAVMLGGCGNSKKGNSYLPQTHHIPSSSRILTSV